MFKHVLPACISVPYLCSWCLRSSEGIGSFGTGVEDVCEPQWVLGIEPGSLAPLLEQPVLLIAELPKLLNQTCF